jgi:putative transposase
MYPYADLMCYCLMRNHFHLIVRFRSYDEISDLIIKADITLVPGKLNVISDEKLTLFLSQQFSNYFNSYAKAYNMENFRRGALFKRAFRRIPIQTDDYMMRLIRYVHQNPVSDCLAKTIEEWKYSSYSSILSINPTLIPRTEILELFGDLENFIFYHKQTDTGVEF